MKIKPTIPAGAWWATADRTNTCEVGNNSDDKTELEPWEDDGLATVSVRAPCLTFLELNERVLFSQTLISVKYNTQTTGGQVIIVLSLGSKLL